MGKALLQLAQPCVVPLATDSRPIVEVDLGLGKPLRFLLDVGADVSLLDERCAKELGIELLPYATPLKVRGSTGGEIELRDFVRVERLVLGDLVVRQPGFTVIGGTALAEANADGILGQDLLARLVLVFDMQRDQLHILTEGGVEKVEAYLTSAKIADGAWGHAVIEFLPTPVLPFRVPGVADPLPFHLDTGAVGTSLPQAMITALGLQPLRKQKSSGVDGTREADVYRVENFSLFGLAFAFEATASAREQGLLGMDVLGELVFVIDGPQRTLWLHHRK